MQQLKDSALSAFAAEERLLDLLKKNGFVSENRS
jgi:hypothetical protein